MIVSQNFETQLAQFKLYLRQGLALFDAVFCGENVEIKAGIADKISSLSSISNVKIGSFSLLGSGDYRCACIGNYCTFAEGVKILDKRDYSFINSAMCHVNNHNAPSKIFKNFDRRQPSIITTEHTLIGHDVWVGSKVKIKNGLVIGHGAILEDGAVVTQHVPPYTVVAGNPARFVRLRFAPEMIERFLRSAWFTYDLQGLELDWEDTAQCLSQIEQYIESGAVTKLEKGYTFKIQNKGNLVIRPDTWNLEQSLYRKFGTANMQEIFAMPQIRSKSLVAN